MIQEEKVFPKSDEELKEEARKTLEKKVYNGEDKKSSVESIEALAEKEYPQFGQGNVEITMSVDGIRADCRSGFIKGYSLSRKQVIEEMEEWIISKRFTYKDSDNILAYIQKLKK